MTGHWMKAAAAVVGGLSLGLLGLGASAAPATTTAVVTAPPVVGRAIDAAGIAMPASCVQVSGVADGVGAGGGALIAFRGISAAKAEPDTIASAVANKTHFFMTIPITFQNQSDFGAPRAQTIIGCTFNFLTWCQSGMPRVLREAKRAGIC